MYKVEKVRPMAMWKKHRFLSLEEEDGEDKIMAGSQFVIKYVGSTYVKEELEGSASEEVIMEFYNSLVESFHTDMFCVFRLIVDLSGAVFYDKEGKTSQRFELCDIRDIIYCNKIQEYLKCFILVAREEGDLNVKAHVLVCESKEKARNLYKTFIDTFTLAAEMKKIKRQTSDSSIGRCSKGKPSNHPSNGIPGGTGSCPAQISLIQEARRPAADGLRLPKWSSPSMTSDSKLDSEGNSETYLGIADAFTALARSRTHSSDVSPVSSSTSENEAKFIDFTLSEDNVFW